MKTLTQPQKNSGNPQLSLFPESRKEITSPGKKADRLPEEFYQYFLLISPPRTVKQKVKGMKITLNKTIGLSRENLHSIAHVSLLSFHSATAMSENSIAALQQVFSQSNSFNVVLNGFDFFEHGNSKTIYSKIENAEPIKKVHDQLRELFNIPVKSFVPHLAIARSIENPVSDKGLRIIKQHRLEEHFLCDKITILERKLKNGIFSNYKVFHEVKLK